MSRNEWEDLFRDCHGELIIKSSPNGIAIYGATAVDHDDDSEFIDFELEKEIERTNARWHEGR